MLLKFPVREHDRKVLEYREDFGSANEVAGMSRSRKSGILALVKQLNRKDQF